MAMKGAYLVVRGQLHSADTVDVFSDSVKEIIPAFNESTLVLVVDQLQLISVPNLTHLEEFMKECWWLWVSFGSHLGDFRKY